jgi:hypothetical protein
MVRSGYLDDLTLTEVTAESGYGGSPVKSRGPQVKIEIPEWIWEKYAKIARALDVDGEDLIASALASALSPFHIVTALVEKTGVPPSGGRS